MAPTLLQKQNKIKFWRMAKNNALLDIDSMSVQDMADLINEPQLKLWMNNAEFRAWFLDDHSLNDLINLGAEEAVTRLIAIVKETEVGPREAVSASSQVAAAKILLDFAGMAPAKKTETTVRAGDLPDDEKALREYIERNVKKLNLVDK